MIDETTLACLINHPCIGAAWLADCEVLPENYFKGQWYVIGEVEDRSVPEGHSTMNFPVTCIRKWGYLGPQEPRIESEQKGKYIRLKRGDGFIDEHRWVWEQVNGPIPVDYEIHHLNGDTRDNRIENLELMLIVEHRRMHGLSRPHPPARLCEIEGCGRIHCGRGLCQKHWQNFYRKPRRKNFGGVRD